jgi:hypothetical protein
MTSSSAGEEAKALPAAVVFATSLNTALVLATVRLLGSQEAASCEYAVHEALWREQLGPYRASGRLTGPLECAGAHLLIEREAGMSVSLFDSHDEKVWLLYPPPYRLGDGPLAPGTGVAAIPGEVGHAYFRARHAATAAYAGIRFVQTHDMTEGDICDAGYFMALSPSSESYAWEHGTEPPPGLVLDRTAGEQVSAARCGALLMANRTELHRRIGALCERAGTASAALIAEHALATVLVGRYQWLLDRLDMTGLSSPLYAAQLYAESCGWMGDRPAVMDHGDHALVRHDSAVTPLLPGSSERFLQAAANAWAAVLPLYRFEAGVSLDLGSSPGTASLRFFDRQPGRG